ncbi:MAG: class D sortase [Patescibacteria group bacterium]
MPNKRTFNKPLIILGVIFLLVGVGGLSFPFLPFGLSGDLDYLDAVAQERVVDVPMASSSFSSSPTPAPSFDPNRPNIKNRLFISKLDISMPIFESDDADVLVKGGWIFPGTSTPEYASNTVIFGHRFRYLPPVSNTFYALDKIRAGDEIKVSWKGTTYTYRTTEIKIIEPTDFSVLNSTDKATITLITCAPLFSTKQRLVVIAELI